MKKYSKADLQDKAERIMQAHNVTAVFGTSDGEVFLKEHEAKTHVRDTGGAPGETLEIYPYGVVAGKAEAPSITDNVDLHGDAGKLKAEKAEKAKAAEAAKVPGTGKGKKAETVKAADQVGEDTNQEGVKPEEPAKETEGGKPEEPAKEGAEGAGALAE